MKRLYLLRHAQSLNTPLGGKDFDRALSPQGSDDAKALGVFMNENSYNPELSYYSSAKRTFETFSGLHLKNTISEANEDMYDASAEKLIDILHDSDEHGSILLIGHNPAMHELSMRLASEESPASHMQRLMHNYKPGTLSVFDCTCVFWNDLQLGENMLVNFLEPLDYNAPDRPTRWM